MGKLLTLQKTSRSSKGHKSLIEKERVGVPQNVFDFLFQGFCTGANTIKEISCKEDKINIKLALCFNEHLNTVKL